ncbi:MAG: hypothetical protein HKM05_09505 [Spirochaetales bacterium]|nr:hypothetical protein [Spirochaetales bacterium]
MEYTPETPLETAKRGFQEETRLWKGSPPIPEALPEVSRLSFPYQWSTFLWVIENPDLKPSP